MIKNLFGLHSSKHVRFKQIDVWVLAFENFNEKQCKKQRERVKRPQTLSTTYIPKQPLRATASHISFG